MCYEDVFLSDPPLPCGQRVPLYLSQGPQQVMGSLKLLLPAPVVSPWVLPTPSSGCSTAWLRGPELIALTGLLQMSQREPRPSSPGAPMPPADPPDAASDHPGTSGGQSCSHCMDPSLPMGPRQPRSIGPPGAEWAPYFARQVLLTIKQCWFVNGEGLDAENKVISTVENKERPWWKTISEEFLGSRNGVISESQRSKSEGNKNPKLMQEEEELRRSFREAQSSKLPGAEAGGTMLKFKGNCSLTISHRFIQPPPIWTEQGAMCPQRTRHWL
eukprot:bmy_15090T0